MNKAKVKQETLDRMLGRTRCEICGGLTIGDARVCRYCASELAANSTMYHRVGLGSAVKVSQDNQPRGLGRREE
jgi:ribosomal protein S14